jgi:hypothetical protein
MAPQRAGASGSPPGSQPDSGGAGDASDHQRTTSQPPECPQMDTKAEFERINAELVRVKVPEEIRHSLEQLY